MKDAPQAAAEFTVGFTVEWDKQVYRPVAVRDHTTKAGALVKLIEWETECPRCAVTFIATSMLAASIPRRFCQACARPGFTVKRMRKKLRKEIRDMTRPDAGAALLP